MKKFVVLSQKEDKDTCIVEQLQSYVDRKKTSKPQQKQKTTQRSTTINKPLKKTKECTTANNTIDRGGIWCFRMVNNPAADVSEILLLISSIHFVKVSQSRKIGQKLV